MSPAFLIAADRTLGIEGGYVNNPKDPGGETKWGISKRSYPHLNIKDLTRDDALEIYYRDFWAHVDGDSLPQSVAYQLFDIAINHGCETAKRMLQRTVGVADDGHIGPITRAAVARHSETDMIMKLIAERLEFWAKLSIFDEFGRGWVNRAAADLRYGAQDT